MAFVRESVWKNLSPEAKRLAQALHDVRRELGADLDGDATAGADIAGMGLEGFCRMVVEEAKQLRLDYNEAIDEMYPPLPAKSV